MAQSDLQAILDAVEARVDYLRSSTEAPAADGWLPCASLRGEHLAELIRSTAEGRGTDDPQVAASLFAQGYAFRLPSVALGAYALGLDVPSVAPGSTAIKLGRHRPAAVAYLDPEPRPADGLVEELFAGHLAPFVEAVRGCFTVGARLLWGNVAASCATAFRAVDADRDRADRFFAEAGPWLDGLGSFVGDSWTWERTNCCLWYQTESGFMCDDCSLRRAS
jgi:ferric iron reductase protein FhuF